MPNMDSISAVRRQIVLYGTNDLYRDIQEHAARDLMTASAWMRRVILDRLRADGRRDEQTHPTT
jgi:hypothetical protein